MTKLADIELDDLQADILNGNLTNWVRDKVVEKLADKFVERGGDNIIHNTRIREDDLRKRVIEKLADEIIENWRNKK